MLRQAQAEPKLQATHKPAFDSESFEKYSFNQLKGECKILV